MKWLWIILMLGAVAAAAEIVTLAWNPVAEPSVTGYRLYAGTNSRSYFIASNVVGRANTTGTVELPFPAWWYFAVTATNAAGVESAYSEEVVWVLRPTAPQVFADSYVKLLPQAERTTNLVTWAPMTLEPTLVPATNAQEFFRLTGLEIQPLKVIK